MDIILDPPTAASTDLFLEPSNIRLALSSLAYLWNIAGMRLNFTCIACAAITWSSRPLFFVVLREVLTKPSLGKG